ncbi:hypothetical protein COO60DRAFT_711494 [Scenedesmus sp. NREL 46B-D3]|nr:hypothetical protein COO60DRAFT_711494 [Scenedesmus sp. NREL 46B-D3]
MSPEPAALQAEQPAAGEGFIAASGPHHVRPKAGRTLSSSRQVARDQQRTTQPGSNRPVEPRTAAGGAGTVKDVAWKDDRWQRDQRAHHPTDSNIIKSSSSQAHEHSEQQRQQASESDGTAVAAAAAEQARRRGMSDSQRSGPASAGRDGRDGSSREGAAQNGGTTGGRPHSAHQQHQQQQQRPRSPQRSRGGDRRQPLSPGRHLPPSPRHHELPREQQQQWRPEWDDRQQRRPGAPSPRGPPPPPLRHGFPVHPRDRDAFRDNRDGRSGGYRDGPAWDSRDRDRGPGAVHHREPRHDDRGPARDFGDRDRHAGGVVGGYRGPPAGGGRPSGDGLHGGGIPPPPPARDRSRSRERGGRQQQQQQQQQAPRGPGAGGCGVEMGNAFALLERFLSKHEALRETIAPTAANVNTVHLSRTDTVTFIGVQQWLALHLGLELQLLAGTFVLVPAHDIPLLGELRQPPLQRQHRQPRQQQR